jgi:hypothetical protein
MHIEPTACPVSIRVSSGNAAQSETLSEIAPHPAGTIYPMDIPGTMIQ